MLITGFNDWRNLGNAGIWRCRENPSCRLLLKGESHSKPAAEDFDDGELVKLLRAHTGDLDFDFVTLPTVWGTAVGMDRSGHEVVVHIGLGVYDCHNELLLERGAINKWDRCGHGNRRFR